MATRLARWLLFTVIISLLPFIMTGVDLWTDGKIADLWLWHYGALLWPRGELLLVAIAIGGDAAGALVATDSASEIERFFKIASVGGCIILAVGAAWWYEKIQESATHVSARVVQGSGGVLIVVVVIAFICKAVWED